MGRALRLGRLGGRSPRLGWQFLYLWIQCSEVTAFSLSIYLSFDRSIYRSMYISIYLSNHLPNYACRHITKSIFLAYREITKIIIEQTFDYRKFKKKFQVESWNEKTCCPHSPQPLIILHLKEKRCTLATNGLCVSSTFNCLWFATINGQWFLLLSMVSALFYHQLSPIPLYHQVAYYLPYWIVFDSCTTPSLLHLQSIVCGSLLFIVRWSCR